MSRTFTSRPTAQTRGRGGGPSRQPSRGRALPLHGGHLLGNDISNDIQPAAHTHVSHNSHQNNTSRSISGNTAQFPRRTSVNSSSTSTKTSNTATSIGSTSRGRGTGSCSKGSTTRNCSTSTQTRKMEEGATGRCNRPSQTSESNCMENAQKSQVGAGYTMFTPNEKRRSQIAEMAQKETAAYQNYKKQNATKSVNYVGTVGGGSVSQEEATRRRALEARTQRLNRSKKQEEQRAASKEMEERKIEAMRAEQRRKAEQNLAREGRAPQADEIRRNREAFLQSYESKNSTANAATSSPNETQPQSTHPKKDKAVSDQMLASAYRDSAEQSVLNTLGSEEVLARNDSLGVVTRSNRSSELDNLCAMFPKYDETMLSELLVQVGSVDGVVEMLGI